MNDILPYRVLELYNPTRWNPSKIGIDLTRITRASGLVPHVDPIHGPLLKVPWVSQELHAEVRRRTFNTKKAEDWHYDGDTTPGANPECCLVLWASNTPTEIMYNGHIYIPAAREVIIFKNMSVRHRRPPNCPRIRWVFRQRVSVPKHITLL